MTMNFAPQNQSLAIQAFELVWIGYFPHYEKLILVLFQGFQGGHLNASKMAEMLAEKGFALGELNSWGVNGDPANFSPNINSNSR